MSSAEQFDCIDPELGELLPFYVDGQLSAEDRRLAAAHLQACVRCAEEERSMRDLASGIASLRARPHPTASPESRRTSRPAAVAVLVAAVIGVAALLILLLVPARRAVPEREMVAGLRALETRIQHLESQNAVLARAIAMERARLEASPLAGIPIAAPPNL